MYSNALESTLTSTLWKMVRTKPATRYVLDSVASGLQMSPPYKGNATRRLQTGALESGHTTLCRTMNTAMTAFHGAVSG